MEECCSLFVHTAEVEDWDPILRENLVYPQSKLNEEKFFNTIQSRMERSILYMVSQLSKFSQIYQCNTSMLVVCCESAVHLGLDARASDCTNSTFREDLSKDEDCVSNMRVGLELHYYASL